MLLLLTFCVGGLFPADAAPPPNGRESVPLAGPWRFHAYPPVSGAERPDFDDSAWPAVTVPHTWDSKSDMTWHKAAWYRTHFTLSAADRGRPLFVCFDGAATVADVWLNGVYLGQHRGAYTRFVLDATRAASLPGDPGGGDNVLAVRCDTDPKDTTDCLPAGDGYQLYHVYGGLYRPARLLKTPPIHIDSATDGASGVFLTPQVSAVRATLNVRTRVRNDGPSERTLTVAHVLQDAGGRVVARASETLALAAQSAGLVSLTLPVSRPHLWGVRDAYLYRVQTIVTAPGQDPDRVTERTGFRFFRMTPTGFFLNGRLTPLRGVAKHQETEARASAVSEADLREDWAGLRALGVSFVRLAHYPHAALEYDLADEAGVVVWAENGHSHPAGPTETGDAITREMVRQNYNHPSICFWSIGNEAIGVKTEGRDIGTLEHYAQIARAEDPTRLITCASNSKFSQSRFLDFVAANRYNGWYGGAIRGFDAQALRYHYISETGAGGVVTVHTSATLPTHKVNVYEPEEYQQELAEERCQVVFRDHAAQVPLFTWWVGRDFGDPRYKGVNAKGLETYGGFRKDVWYLYQSFLRPDLPVVHLCGKHWFLRRRSAPTDTLTIKAYSNAPALTLTVNGKRLETHRNGDHVLPIGGSAADVFAWPDILSPGRNLVTVDDGAGHSDTAVIYAEAATLDAQRADPSGPLREITSDNPDNPPVFIDLPVQADWPVYSDFDGGADNTYGPIPALLAGARPLVTRRPSRAGQDAAVSFRLAPEAGPTDLFLLVSLPPGSARADLTRGWDDTGVGGMWRDNALNLVPYAVYRRAARGGDRVTLPAVVGLDWAVLVR